MLLLFGELLYKFRSYFSIDSKWVLVYSFDAVLGSNLMLVIDIFGSNLAELELSRIELKLVSPDFYKSLRFLKVLLDIFLSNLPLARPLFFWLLVNK